MLPMDFAPSDKEQVIEAIARASIVNGSLLSSEDPDANGPLSLPPNQINVSSMACSLRSTSPQVLVHHEFNERRNAGDQD